MAHVTWTLTVFSTVGDFPWRLLMCSLSDGFWNSHICSNENVIRSLDVVLFFLSANAGDGRRRVKINHHIANIYLLFPPLQMEKFICHLSWCTRKEQKHDENLSRFYMMATMMKRYFDFRWETEATISREIVAQNELWYHGTGGGRWKRLDKKNRWH